MKPSLQPLQLPRTVFERTSRSSMSRSRLEATLENDGSAYSDRYAGHQTLGPWPKALRKTISILSIDGVKRKEPRVRKSQAGNYGTTTLLCRGCLPHTFDILSPCNCSVTGRLRPGGRGAAVTLELKVEDTVRIPDASMRGFVGQKMRDTLKIWKRSIS